MEKIDKYFSDELGFKQEWQTFHENSSLSFIHLVLQKTFTRFFDNTDRD